jgi:hypothetical protein
MNEFIIHCESKSIKKIKKKLFEKINIEIKQNISTNFDENKEFTKIQICLINGEKIVGKFNLDQKIKDIYIFVKK